MPFLAKKTLHQVNYNSFRLSKFRAFRIIFLPFWVISHAVLSSCTIVNFKISGEPLPIWMPWTDKVYLYTKSGPFGLDKLFEENPALTEHQGFINCNVLSYMNIISTLFANI